MTETLPHIKRTINVYLSVLIGVFLFLALYNLLVTSVTMDEPDHCFSGYYYWRTGDFSMEPENPPLAELWLGLGSVVLIQPELPSTSSAFYKIRDAYSLGKEFLYSNPIQGKFLLFLSRLLVLLFAIPLAIVIFLWSRKLWGPTGALISVFLFALEPNLLAYSGIASPDFISAFFILFALYWLDRFVTSPRVFTLFLTGFAVALALATKFSALLLIPVIIIVLGVWKIKHHQNILLPSEQSGVALLRYSVLLADYFLMLCSGAVIVFFVLWAVYFFECRTVAGVIDPSLSAKGTSLEIALLKRSIPLSSLLLKIFYQVKLPLASFIAGYLKVSAAAQSGGPTFLLGHIYPAGVWYYFPVIFLLKTPLTVLLLFFYSLFTILRTRELWQAHFYQLFIIILFIACYFLASLFVKLNIGYRHLLPVLPLVLILCGAIGKVITQQKLAKIICILLALLLAWSTLRSTGNYIGVFNCAAEASRSGVQLAGDSNLDWGQYMLHLKRWMTENNCEKIYGRLFCPNSYEFYDINFEEIDSMKQLREIQRKGNGVFYVAVSATYLQGTRRWDAGLRKMFIQKSPYIVIDKALYIYRFSRDTRLPERPESTLNDHNGYGDLM